MEGTVRNKYDGYLAVDEISVTVALWLHVALTHVVLVLFALLKAFGVPSRGLSAFFHMHPANSAAAKVTATQYTEAQRPLWTIHGIYTLRIYRLRP